MMKKIYWALGIIASAALIFFVFVPAFAGRISINPIIQIGPLEIRWYGIILALSILISYSIIRKHSWRLGISASDVDDYSFWVIIVSIIGARAYYVLFNWSYFSQNLYETYKIWHGGISIYGALISAIVFSIFYARKKAYSFWQLVDLVVLGLPLGQALGRLGNFINQEAFGTVTNLPWKMYVAATQTYVHPTFLYEMIADLLIFGLIYRLFGKVKSGSLFLIYLLAYSVARLAIESLRTDSLYLHGFRVDQLIALVTIIISGTLLFIRQQRVS